jgi:hypothetical protein
MAAAVIGALRVVLGADTAAFDKGLRNAQGGLASFTAGIKKSLGAAALATAFTGAGSPSFIS